MLDNIVTLGFLVLLQAVLGFDNLLYISLESKRAPEEDRKRVRRIGIIIAVGLRIGLLFALLQLIELAEAPFFKVHAVGFFEGDFNVHSVIVLLGGIFIIYTAVKEIWHMLHYEAREEMNNSPKTTKQVIFMIVLMNLVFSFDSILSAIALTHVFWVLASAIVIGGLIMIFLADGVSRFLEKNRMYEVLGLFVLFIVGIMLLSEGGHIAGMKIFGGEITQMSKTTFYFVITVLILVDLVQTRYQKRLMAAARK